MRCLVVIAHPFSASLCGHLAQRIVQTLAAQAHEVTVLDLYAQEFSPALTLTERSSYYRSKYDSSALGKEIDQLLSAEALVLVFPTWWFGLPAILKGWFDRVWAPGIAYDHASDLGAITPRLHQLRHTLAITSLGSASWVDRFILRQPVKRQLKTAVLGTCAPKSSFQMLSLYKSEKLSAKDVERFNTRIVSAISRWH
jgi:NAD(P)H dehydrogenase (quinone)